MNDTSQDFLDSIQRAQRKFTLPPGLRDRAETFAQEAMAFLFPHFDSPGNRALEPLPRLKGLLASIRDLTPLLPPNADCAEIASCFGRDLPAIRDALLLDATAIWANDPAAEGLDEVILAYPGFYGIAVHRIAHVFHRLGIPYFPRLLSEHAHRQTGIDIHPGATIGKEFSIDHGTGVVIGGTTVIGDRVRIFQGVTLGALSVSKDLAHVKRHPTIEDDVVLYANATILGGKTVVGRGSVIGGNVWLTQSVPPESVVTDTTNLKRPGVEAETLIEFNI